MTALRASTASCRASIASSPNAGAASARRAGHYESRTLSPEARNVLRKLHQTIRRITDDFQGRWHFNTSVAAMMELINACMAAAGVVLGSRPKPFRADVQRKLVLLLNPFAPYLAAELWSLLGEDADTLLRHPWPAL